MTGAPREKSGWHFASDGIHKAMYVWAPTIEEAEQIYHKTKKLIQSSGSTIAPTEQSTGAVDEEIKE